MIQRGRLVPILVLLALLVAGAFLRTKRDPATEAWSEVRPGVWISRGLPHTYALIEGEAALLIGATRGADLADLKRRGVDRVELCLLTHHHRDSSARAGEFLDAKIPVRAPKMSADWLSPEGVRRYWETSLQSLSPEKRPGLRDRTFGDWSYLVHPDGLPVACDLEAGQTIRWRGWTLDIVPTPGHSRDHTAFAARKSSADPPIVFCGDAFCSAGKLWSPYTTDWHHATDEGLVGAAASLRKLAALEPAMLCPEHGPPIERDVTLVLEATARSLDEAALLKSFERFSKERLQDPPQYDFLAREQVATAGDRPWSKVSEHLWLTGNTYVLVSKDGPILVIDPFHPVIGQQIAALQKQEGLGAIEAVLISHAHNDHYQGLYDLPPLPADKRYEVWTLDLVAETIEQPYRFMAPYLDVRGVPVSRRLRDGEMVRWREYSFRATHLPGQTWFTMGLEVTIDGQRCFHVADNFFHMDQFTGSGGWSGRNRGWPDAYAASARQVLNFAPDRVLAEHGGPYVFSSEDYRRRIAWGEAAARAADALSPSGLLRWDWNPTAVRVEPLLVQAAPGESVRVQVIADNPAATPRELTIDVVSEKLTAPVHATLSIPARSSATETITLTAAKDLPTGRHIVPLVVREGDAECPADVFVVLDTR